MKRRFQVNPVFASRTRRTGGESFPTLSCLNHSCLFVASARGSISKPRNQWWDLVCDKQSLFSMFRQRRYHPVQELSHVFLLCSNLDA